MYVWKHTHLYLDELLNMPTIYSPSDPVARTARKADRRGSRRNGYSDPDFPLLRTRCLLQVLYFYRLLLPCTQLDWCLSVFFLLLDPILIGQDKCFRLARMISVTLSLSNNLCLNLTHSLGGKEDSIL